MAGITTALHSATAGRLVSSRFQGFLIDKEADSYLNMGDQKLKEVAVKVSALFLNRQFYTICCCNFPLSIQEIVTKNPHFHLMSKKEINRSMNLLVFNKHQNLVDLIVNKLSADNAIPALGEAIEYLKFYSDRALKDNKLTEAQEYNNMFNWALNRQSDMVTNAAQADKAANRHLFCLDHKCSTDQMRAIDQSLAKIAARVSTEFLDRKFYKICCSNLTLSLREVVNENENFREIDREEAFGSAAVLAINKQKDLIESIAYKITYSSQFSSATLAPSIDFMERVISQLEFSSKNYPNNEEYKEMLEWAQKLHHDFRMTITFELDSYRRETASISAHDMGISIPLSDVLDGCIIS